MLSFPPHKIVEMMHVKLPFMSLSAVALLQAAGSLFLLLIASFLFLFINRRQVLPVNWPIIGMFPFLLANKDRFLDSFVSGLRESGCTFVFKGPWFSRMDVIVTCDPANANHVFNTHFSNYPKGNDFLEKFDVFGQGIFNADGEEWMFQRRISHALLISGEFRSSMAKLTRNKVVNGLLPLLHKVGELDGVVDLNDLFMRLTVDVMCGLVIGVDPACLAPDFPTMPFAKALHDIQQHIFFRHVVPTFWWKLLRKLRLGEEKKMSVSGEVIDEFMARCIKERRVEMSQKKKKEISSHHEDILTSFLENVEVCSRPHPDKFLRDTLFTFLSAGTEPTEVALSWLFFQILKNPDVERKILEELSGIANSSKRDTHHDMSVFDAEETDKLVYLHATLCESLRLIPPLPFNHKVALKPDILPSGHKVPAGMKIFFSMYSMGRMESIWGKDCMEFKPERWILEDGTVKREPSYKFLTFNSGPRLCLGRDMTFTQLKVVAAALIYNFHIQLVEGHAVEHRLAIALQMKNGLMVKVRQRTAHHQH